MATQAANILDLTTISLPDLGKYMFTDLASDYQQTIALKRLWRKNKLNYDSGPSVRFNVMTDTNGSFRFVGLAFTAVVDRPNIMTYGEVPWRGFTFNWGLDGAETVMNSGASKIIDLVKTLRISAMGSAVIGLERVLWRLTAATDDETVLGIPNYVVKSNTAATKANNDGFNGGAPSGYTTVAGLSPTTYPRWQNYATQYTLVTKDDLIRKMRRAARKTDFKPLVEDMPVYDTGKDYGWYSNYAVVSTLEEILESQNENLGDDVASMDGKVMFHRAAVEYVPELENDTTNPVYGIYWGEMFMMRLRDWWLKEIPVKVNPQQPTTEATHVVSRCNMLCRNRRRQSVIATGTSMPS